ncbi:MAG: FecR domain-containing protein [Bacteroidaceae bacterium]|nr:FecR domain-containing protein [Bacteroidaceae bacterium]
MKLNDEHDLISLLICKRIVGTITNDEQQMLDKWRRQNRHNEQVYQRLTDVNRLQVEYHRYRLTDTERPLAEMKKRLGIGRRLWTIRAVAAAVAILIVGVSAFLLQHRQTEYPLKDSSVATGISAGSTKALMALANGKIVELTADTMRNSTLLSDAKSVNSQVPHVAEQVLITPRGGEFRITLEDGTEVWLNAASRLSYPETFSGQQRRVSLEGEAYFKVAKNEAKPFIVTSGNQEVHVYGTEFNVCAYSDEKDIRTTLVEGSISLRPVNGNQSELMLTPGKQAIFDKTDETARVVSVDTEVITSWRTGVFVFEGQTMEQIIHTLSRWYDFDYEFRDAATAQTIFMGSIPKYSSFNEVCDIFHKLGGVSLRQEGHKVIITAK